MDNEGLIESSEFNVNNATFPSFKNQEQLDLKDNVRQIVPDNTNINQ